MYTMSIRQKLATTARPVVTFRTVQCSDCMAHCILRYHMPQLSRRIQCKLVDCTPVFTAVLYLVQIAGAASVAGPTVWKSCRCEIFLGVGGVKGFGTNIFVRKKDIVVSK